MEQGAVTFSRTTFYPKVAKVGNKKTNYTVEYSCRNFEILSEDTSILGTSIDPKRVLAGSLYCTYTVL